MVLYVVNYSFPINKLKIINIPINFGFPGLPRSLDFVENTGYYKFLWKNHVIHHLYRDKDVNFNITLPGGDYILDTFLYHHDKYIIDESNFSIKKK